MTKLDSEFTQKIAEAWESGADSAKIIELLEAAGLSIADEDVEKVLAAIQAKVAKSIGAQELDDAALELVTGGGSGFCEGTADCDKHFKLHPEKTDRCNFFDWCDEHWVGSAYEV